MNNDFEKWYRSYVSGKPVCMDRKQLAKDAFVAGCKHNAEINVEHIKDYMRNKP